MDRYAVIGNPIAHSKSPQIHTQFAAESSQQLSYEALSAPLNSFELIVKRFHQAGGKGVNVTVPFKLNAYSCVDELSERAKRAGAVNTIAWDEQGISTGHNTDGIGLIRDLTVNHGINLAGKKILVLGAGGAVRGILSPLIEQQPAAIFIANRTVEKAQQLANDFSESSDFSEIAAGGFDDIQEFYDLIINGTAAGLHNEIPSIPSFALAKKGCCYDLMYSNEATAFVRWGNYHGAAQALDGLGMLVEQAAESFYIWRGVRPKTASVIQALRP
ncbi:MAG: shikimate dehydrogenase [Gammaproteobacteria bacterium]|nr:shikimate dehydrogenase [Gammaproteobacteria bacterium]